LLELGYTFKNAALLTQAFTHKSYTFEQKLGDGASNERLEFLGDAVLELCISDLLFTLHPKLPEGKLTEKRASLVCEACLAQLARGLNLGAYLRMGNGEEQTGGREKGSLLSDALEAVLGAVYLDGGYDAAQALITRLFMPLAKKATLQRDNKTALQEILQKKSGTTAKYVLLDQSGPSHARTFVSQVTHEGRVLGKGTGHSKKEAEQNAAEAALKGGLV